MKSGIVEYLLMVSISLLIQDQTGVRRLDSKNIHVVMGEKLPGLHQRADKTGGSGRDLRVNNLEPVSTCSRHIATNELATI